jgi:hypothetical protein
MLNKISQTQNDSPYIESLKQSNSQRQLKRKDLHWLIVSEAQGRPDPLLWDVKVKQGGVSWQECVLEAAH